MTVGSWVRDLSREVPSGYLCGCRAEKKVHCGASFLSYTYWTWQPTECSVPPFSAERFVNEFKGNSVRFIGDSVSATAVFPAFRCVSTLRLLGFSAFGLLTKLLQF